mgnify:FL=1
MAKLTPKQKAFVDEYLIDLNATQAAIRAGHSTKTARKIGQENLTKPDIQTEIQKRIKDRKKRTEITQDFVLNELYAIASSNGSDFAQVIEEPIIQNNHYVKDPDTGKLRMQEVVKIIPTDKLPEEKKKAIAGIREGKYGIEVATCDKVRALELLGRHLGMFTDNIKLKSDANTEVTIKIGGEEYEG